MAWSHLANQRAGKKRERAEEHGQHKKVYHGRNMKDRLHYCKMDTNTQSKSKSDREFRTQKTTTTLDNVCLSGG